MSNPNEVEVPPTRDEIRAKIFQSKVLKREIIEFFGMQIEIRQSTLTDILNAREEENGQSAVIRNLVQNAYVPKTDIKVFEDTDADSFGALPFGADFIRVSKALEKLSEVNFLDAKPGSPVDQAG